MQKRLFIGVDLNDEWNEFLNEFIALQNIPGARWTKKGNMHLTLLFLGNSPEALIPEIEASVKETAHKTVPFHLNYDSFVYAPKPGNPRMIWARFNKNLEYASLARHLYDLCAEIFRSAGNDVEFDLHAELIPHITLARLQEVKNPPPIDVDDLEVPETFQVNDIVLYESILKRTGSEYHVIGRWRLKG